MSLCEVGLSSCLRLQDLHTWQESLTSALGYSQVNSLSSRSHTFGNPAVIVVQSWHRQAHPMQLQGKHSLAQWTDHRKSLISCPLLRTSKPVLAPGLKSQQQF